MSAVASYKFIRGEGHTLLTLTGPVGPEQWKLCASELSSYLGTPVPYFVVNCAELTDLSPDWIRGLLELQKTLQTGGKDLRLIIVKSALVEVLKREGVDAVFKRCPTQRDALIEFGLISKKRLDTDFLNPFLDATLRVLSVQASTTASAKKALIKQGDEAQLGDISGVIGIVSETFNGSVVISFPEQTFLKIMSSMLGEECTTLSKDIVDGAGELTNMIFGQAKITLNEKGYGIKTALPSVVTGKGHSLQTLTKGPVVVVPFESTAGDFFVEICLSD
jgi:chemotaxis protein CheX